MFAKRGAARRARQPARQRARQPARVRLGVGLQAFHIRGAAMLASKLKWPFNGDPFDFRVKMRCPVRANIGGPHWWQRGKPPAARASPRASARVRACERDGVRSSVLSTKEKSACILKN